MGILYTPYCKNGEHLSFSSSFHIILKISGCWPTHGDEKSFWFRFLDKLYTCWFCFVFWCLAFPVYAECVYLLNNLTDVTKAVENMCTSIIGMLVACRMLHVRYEMKALKLILRIFADKIWINDKSHPSIYAQCIKRTMPRFYLSLALWAVLTLYAIVPIATILTTEQTMESTDKKLPYSMTFPYDDQPFWIYIFTYLLSTSAGVITVSQYYAMDALLALFISFLCGQFEILHDSVARLIPECHAEWLKIQDYKDHRQLQNMYKRRLQKIYLHHNDLINFSQQVDNFISLPLFINFSCSTFQIGFVAFQFLIGGTNSFSDFLRFFLFFCSVTGQLYMMCDLGSMLISRSEDTARHLFLCNWEGGRISENSPLRLQHYDDTELDMLSVKLPLWQYINYYPTDEDFQHKLRFMIMRSHRPVQLAAMKYTTLSLESFNRVSHMLVNVGGGRREKTTKRKGINNENQINCRITKFMQDLNSVPLVWQNVDVVKKKTFDNTWLIQQQKSKSTSASSLKVKMILSSSLSYFTLLKTFLDKQN